MSCLVCGVAAVAAAAPNVLVVIADDLGTDKLSTYVSDMPGYTPVAGDMPVTPMLDRLAAGGVRFRNTWANPLCSPTRGGILTGQQAYRTGVGSVVGTPTGTPPLRTSSVTLAELLDPSYATGMFGKWHLGVAGLDADGDEDEFNWTRLGAHDAVPNPNRHGFEVFDGGLHGGIPSYWDWLRVSAADYGTESGDEHSVVIRERNYATRVTSENAAVFMADAVEPWLAVVAFNAGHVDSGGLSRDHARQGCSTITTATTDRQAYRAAIECLDHELDAMLADLEATGQLDHTVIFFVGDNGTDRLVSDPDFPHAAQAKGTAFEAGIRVPLIVAEGKHLSGSPYGTTYAGVPFAAGDLVRTGGTSAQLVQTLDLFDTIAEIAELTPGANDAVSFAPQLLDPAAPGRSNVYTELYADEDLDGVIGGFAAQRNARWKLVVTQLDTGAAVPCQSERLFDLVADPGETIDRRSDPAAATARANLRASIDAKVTAFESQPGRNHWLLRASEGAPRCP